METTYVKPRLLRLSSERYAMLLSIQGEYVGGGDN